MQRFPESKADAKWPAFVNQPMPARPSKPVSQQAPQRRDTHHTQHTQHIQHIQHPTGQVLLHTSHLANSSTTKCQRPSFDNDNPNPASLLLKRRLPRKPAAGEVAFDVSSTGWLKMETITIPSPSVFLSSPVVQSAKLPAPTNAAPQRRKNATSRQSSTTSKSSAGVTKPKQSKSRNGCITCKAKRLKCDETKPSCQQCHKRSVTCGGYKKDFKWRPFEEATFNNKVAPPRVKRRSISLPKPPDPGPSESPSDTSTTEPVVDAEADATMQENLFLAASHSPSALQMPDISLSGDQMQPSMPFDMSTPSYLRPIAPHFEANSVTSPLDSLFTDTDFITPQASRSGQSPRLIDLLLPGSELNARPSNLELSQIQQLEFPAQLSSNITGNDVMEEDVEEIIRHPQMLDNDVWLPLYNSHVGSGYSSRSDSPTVARDDPFHRLYRQPEVQAGSPEMLMLRFDRQTCGILSVKDGPTENPWRTLVWPLARDSTALYHAIASMTAFHHARDRPALRVDGIEHMRSSIRSLASGIEKMRTDTALATTLVLAFSESWDVHISTGIEHLRGARVLVNQALAKHSKRPLDGDDLARLKFLCNTWVYMDVIARLTSIDDDDDTDFDTILAPLNGSFERPSTDIDPLMGCATTLFPLIGRAANLCRKVRAMESNSIAIISQAVELKEQIEQWQPCRDLEDPEDPSCKIRDALQTAEAYRFATLLYLHQAVPEIPSLTSAQLAQEVLRKLATVPLSSRVVIVQIYPLLAAGCEAYDNEARKWVEDRWLAMTQRMWIGNIDKCLVVTREVWNRRDLVEAAKEAAKITQRRPTMMHSESSKRKFEEEQMEDMFSFSDMLNGTGSSGSNRARNSFSMAQTGTPQTKKNKMEPITEQMDPEMTVRGKLHWVGVMKEWGWEVLLG